MSFETPRIRNRKYKLAAKERRRVVRARKMDEGKSPKDKGEELPPFFIPPRYKLMFKYMQGIKNSSRLHRKPIPSERKKEFGAEAKAFA